MVPAPASVEHPPEGPYPGTFGHRDEGRDAGHSPVFLSRCVSMTKANAPDKVRGRRPSIAGPALSQEVAAVPRKKQEPIDADIARSIGGLLRGLRRSAGYRAVKDAAARPGCPAAQQTIYAYERGGLVPSLKQLMELVEFYCLQGDGASPEIRYQGVAAMIAALSTPAYHITEALDLINRLQPAPAAGRRRRKR
jgi:hypothetical protein